MSNAATRKDIDEVLSVISDFMERVDDRFNQAEENVNQIEGKLSSIEVEIVDLKESHNRLLNTVDGFVSRIDKYETELAARDRQFAKLVDWAREVSEKTGIPLKNL